MKVNNWIRLYSYEHDYLGTLAMLEVTHYKPEVGSILADSTEDVNTYRLTPETLRKLAKACGVLADHLETKQVVNNDALDKSQAW